MIITQKTMASQNFLETEKAEISKESSIPTYLINEKCKKGQVLVKWELDSRNILVQISSSNIDSKESLSRVSRESSDEEGTELLSETESLYQRLAFSETEEIDSKIKTNLIKMLEVFESNSEQEKLCLSPYFSLLANLVFLGVVLVIAALYSLLVLLFAYLRLTDFGFVVGLALVPVYWFLRNRVFEGIVYRYKRDLVMKREEALMDGLGDGGRSCSFYYCEGSMYALIELSILRDVKSEGIGGVMDIL